MMLGCLVVLSPWALRNWVTLGEPQFLAPKNSNLPGELVPYGFMAWEKTWLYRVRDCYLVPWKLNEESISVDDIPARAFDTPEEKQRVAAILEQYNNDLTLTPKEDAEFSKLARERTSRHPLRTYLWLPAARAVTIWFTPRIELLPVSGHVFPLAQMREDDPVDQEVTSLFFVVNLFYVGLGVWSAARLWRSNPAARPAVTFLALFIVLRTAFLTTLETPEPRYVLVCFPALIALGAQVFTGRSEGQ
jgi:4-amino-4-deoxy-L-arabinose transferase-like glycosyltransferase